LLELQFTNLNLINGKLDRYIDITSDLNNMFFNNYYKIIEKC